MVGIPRNLHNFEYSKNDLGGSTCIEIEMEINSDIHNTGQFSIIIDEVFR